MSSVKETSMLPPGNLALFREEEADVHMQPRSEDRVVSLMHAALAASESADHCGREPSSELNEIEMLHKFEESKLDLQDPDTVRFLEKITVAQVAGYSSLNTKDLVKKFASVTVKDAALAENDDLSSMPFVKFVHFSKEQLHSCIDKVPDSLLPFVYSCRGEDADCEQLLSFLQLITSSDSTPMEKAIAIQCFDNLPASKIDEILLRLDTELLRMITPSQLRQLTFTSQPVCFHTLLKMFPCSNDQKLAYIIYAKNRFSNLSYQAVNTIFSTIALVPCLMRLISDDQLKHLDWDSITPCQLSVLFPTDTREELEETKRRINLLPSDTIRAIKDKLPRAFLLTKSI